MNYKRGTWNHACGYIAPRAAEHRKEEKRSAPYDQDEVKCTVNNTEEERCSSDSMRAVVHTGFKREKRGLQYLY